MSSDPWGMALPHNGSFTFSMGHQSSNNSSSATPEQSQGQGQSRPSPTVIDKRRKVMRACDMCRRKKIKCDGPMNSNSANKCANCEEYGFDCTYVEAAKRRGPPKGYIETLEQRCGRLEKALQQMNPSFDWNSVVGPPLDRDEFDMNAYKETLQVLRIPPWPATKPVDSPRGSIHDDDSKSALAARIPSPSSRILGASPWETYEQDPNRPPPSPEHELADAHMHMAIAQAMNKLDIKDHPWRFHGKASPHHLIMTFNELRYSVSGRNLLEGLKDRKRNEYWQVPEWEIVIAHEGVRDVDYSCWPNDKLADSLIDAYFEQVNFHLPLLNKPIFVRQYRSGLYKNSHDFAKVCLMVFANGSRFVDDEAVYWPKDEAMTEEGKDRLRQDTDGTLRYSAGWKYVRTLLRMGRSVMQGPNLFDFQAQVLTCCFLLGSAVPHLTWIVSGLGLRAAQEIGIHVRSILLHADPVERGLYNRAFWCLYHIDRLNCAAIGRSVAIQDTDFDADYPISVDDEYWEEGNFVQPPEAGVPKVAAFIHTLKLDHIIGAALRTIYAINKLPEHRADSAAQRSIVVELDSALNSWADAVPDGLRWDPTRGDSQLFQQSAVLYVHYYYCQILVHRPFIPTHKTTESIGLPALAICSNASRSICNIVDTVMRRGRQQGLLPGRILTVHFMLPIWIAAVILLISIYTGRQQPGDRERATLDVRKCIAAMKELELTWRQAGKLTDVLLEIAEELDQVGGPNGLAAVATPGPNQGEKRQMEETPQFGCEQSKVDPKPFEDMLPFPATQETLFDASIFDNLHAFQNSDFLGNDDLWSQLFPPGYS